MKRILLILVAFAIALSLALYLNARRVAAPETATTPVTPSTTTATAAPAATSSGPTGSTTPESGPVAYVEDRHYRRVPHPQPVEDPKIVKVEEFFWYGCPHCLHMEALLASWVPALPADVRFVRVPENLGRPEGIIHQRAFYAAENLGVEARIHLPLMTALIVQHQPLVIPQVIANFVANQTQVKAADFNSQFSSFVVDGEVRSASERSFAYGITGVPSLIVGGRYLVDSGLPGITDGGGDEAERFSRMLKVADFLIDKVRTEQSPPRT